MARRSGGDSDRTLIEAIDHAAVPLSGGLGDYDRLLAEIGDSRVVLLGEASHGTDDFYRERAEITKRLVAEKGFEIPAEDKPTAPAEPPKDKDAKDGLPEAK